MKIAYLTNEYPPHIYGGAGIHIESLIREVTLLDGGSHELHVLCFGDQRGTKRNITVNGIAPVFYFPSRDHHHSRVSRVCP